MSMKPFCLALSVVCLLVSTGTSALAAGPVGVVNRVAGSCAVVRAGRPMPAKCDLPVKTGDKATTDRDSTMSIQFKDKSTLMLDQNSEADIDAYVYPGKDSNLLLKFAKGTFRTVTGELVKANPEGFNMQTPLATLGIRGSDVYAIIQPTGEEVGTLHLDPGHALEIRTASQSVRLTKGGQRVFILPDGRISPPEPLPNDLRFRLMGLEGDQTTRTPGTQLPAGTTKVSPQVTVPRTTTTPRTTTPQSGSPSNNARPSLPTQK